MAMVKRSVIIENGKVVNVTFAEEEYAFERGWVVSDIGEIGDSYNGSVFTPPVIELKVPAVISRRQAKQELYALGKLALVQTKIDDIVDIAEKMDTQIYWDDATEFRRDHPTLIALATAIGLDTAQTDAAFISAILR